MHHRSPISLGDHDPSRLYVFQYIRSKHDETFFERYKFMTPEGTKEEMARHARQDYKQQISVHLQKAIEWAEIGEAMKTAIPRREYEKATKNTPGNFKDWQITLGNNNSSSEIRAHYENLLLNRTYIDFLQSTAVDLLTIKVEVSNIVGLLWERVLLKRNVVISDASLQNLEKKRNIAREFVPDDDCTIELNNDRSHQSLSKNVKVYNEMHTGKRKFGGKTILCRHVPLPI